MTVIVFEKLQRALQPHIVCSSAQVVSPFSYLRQVHFLFGLKGTRNPTQVQVLPPTVSMHATEIQMRKYHHLDTFRHRLN